MPIEAPDFLPLGSVITLKGNDKSMMVISRGVVIKEDDGSKKYADYGLVLYPEGLIGDTVVYSNHDCITKVLFKGYSDEEEEGRIADLKEVLPKVDYEKIDPQPAESE